MDENGEQFLEFCAIDDLVIAGTLFKITVHLHGVTFSKKMFFTSK